MSTEIKLGWLIQSGGFTGKMLSNMIGSLGKKALIDPAVPLANDVSSKLATKASSSVLDKFEREVSGQGAVRAGKGFILFI